MKPYTHTVQYYETDKMGITHHSNYVRWMEEARVDFLAQLGIPFAKLEADGIVSPVTAVECKFKNVTTFSDVISIAVEVQEFTGIRLRIKYTMTKQDGTFICECYSEHCFLHKDLTPIRLNKEFPEFYATIISAIKK